MSGCPRPGRPGRSRKRGAACGDERAGAGRSRTKFSQEQIDGRAVQRPALFTDKERLAGGLHARAFFQPCAHGPQFVAAQGLRGR